MRIFSLVCLFFFLSLSIKSQTPATEVRGVWLTTNWNLDWPVARQSIDQQKKNLQDILDRFEKLNINTVFFQTRIRGDVFHKSAIEPRSPYGKADFDYLSYVIEECHKRGMECHAWIVTFPLGSKNQIKKLGKSAVANKHKALATLFKNEWYLDPGNPDTRAYIVSVVNEIVRNYDVDGVHFDYIRYPENAKTYPDKNFFAKYGKGQTLENWRRSNINKLVSDIYDSVKSIKYWVQVSSSPIGKYKDLGKPGSSWTAYSSVFQDAASWMQAGKHDALYPMLYYSNKDFFPYLDDWMKECGKRLVVPGIGVYKMLPNEADWDLKVVTDQINYTREHNIKGQAYFRAGNLLSNIKGVETELKNIYAYPAKLPAMTWLDSVAPNSPIDLQVYRNERGKLCLSWLPYSNDETQTYTLYCSTVEDVDINNPQNILKTGIRGNSIELDMEEGDFGFYYSLTASDRFHNESVACFPAFFVHSEFEK